MVLALGLATQRAAEPSPDQTGASFPLGSNHCLVAPREQRAKSGFGPTVPSETETTGVARTLGIRKKIEHRHLLSGARNCLRCAGGWQA